MTTLNKYKKTDATTQYKLKKLYSSTSDIKNNHSINTFEIFIKIQLY